MIELAYIPNPIAQALIILLEECRELNIFDDYIRSSPLNVPIDQDLIFPVLLDDLPKDQSLGEVGPIEIHHPGAVMVYLAEKARSKDRDRKSEFLWQAPAEHFAAVQWVMWQTSHQAFRPRFEGGPAIIERAERLYRKLDQCLDRGHIAGEHYSIADMMCFPWVVSWRTREQNFGQFERLQSWFERVGGRPAVKSGMQYGREKPDKSRLLPSEPLTRAVQYSYLPGDPTTRYP